jgi:two-component system osmolarity sensor histidine kinase EnvZ
MNLKPRTLLARLMILIALLLAAGQFAAFRLFDYFEREPRAQTAALQAISVVNFTRSALLAAQEDRRLPLLQELSQREGLRIYPVDLFEVVEPLPDDPLTQRVAALIRNALGNDTLVAYNHLGITGLWVSLPIDDEEFWVVIPNVRIERVFPWHWLGWGAVILALSLAGAYFIAARINRPLKLLSKAADQLAKGEPVQHLPVDGVEDLQHVSQTFNEMTDALARLDAERTLLLAGVSHDLRTPLARLRLSVEMLPESESLRAGMVQDIEDMDSIIRQFMDFIRGIEGENAHPDDLNALVTSVTERYQRSGQSIQTSLATLPAINLRPQAMQRMLTNLIDNALKYGDGPVEIITSIHAGKSSLSVIDHGPGIPEADMPRLLRPFERLDQARGAASGSGLGLAIADRIARLHGGTLELLNRPEGGLEVRVLIPI